MHSEYEDEIYEDEMLCGQPERTSDIQLPPVIDFLLFALWIVICSIGFAVIFLAKSAVAGAVVIAVPTFIGMVIKPTFGLCILMLVLPTGAGVGFRQVFSLDRGVGLALAVSFCVNVLVTRPGLRIGNKALWIAGAYTLWVCIASLAGPYLGYELVRAFTQVQLLAMVLIVYWILQTNGEKTFRWASRAYVAGTLGTIALTFITGAAIRAMEDSPEHRYAATLGEATDANMLASLAAIAFLAAIYLFVRDKSVFWRLLYLVAILFLPVMLLKIGSRGALIALLFTMLSPLLFIRQVARKPALVALMFIVVLMASLSAGLVVRSRGLEAAVATRLTDVHQAEEAINYRMMPVKQAVKAAVRKPLGTSYYGWFQESGLRILPHNDFFMALGLYGIPAAVLFAFFIVLITLTIKRIPLGAEKLYARAILTYLLIMGLNVGQLYQKHYWVFLAFVMASERVASFFNATDEEPLDCAEYEEDLLLRGQFA
ncbi:MAG: O-antigen ligase family protein [Planctomycetota bacterium]|jgi:O-antigen ligase